ncbi:MAG: hypothetical protein KAR84_01705 [Elusimicrobiales bacterium]|nr:hypothetical protein [Elusimicrobiales bacterium]
MVKVKFYKRIKDVAILYKINDISKLNNKLIESLEWPENMLMMGFDFKSAQLDKKKTFSIKVSSKYGGRVAYCSQGKGLKNIGESVPQAGIELREPKNFEELRKVHRKILSSYFKLAGKSISVKYKKLFKEYSEKYLKKVNPIVIVKGKKVVGLFAILNDKGASGKVYDTMAWHNLLPGLSSRERKSAYYQAAKWIKENATRQVAVVVDNFDPASRKFFIGLGFKPYRLIITRLDKK